MGLTTPVNRPIGLLQLPGRRVTLIAMEREGLLNKKVFVAASFIAFCVLAVALLGVAT